MFPLDQLFLAPRKALRQVVWTLSRYVTLQFRDRHGAGSLCYRYRTAITILIRCEQRPYPEYHLRSGAKAMRYSLNIASIPLFGPQILDTLTGGQQADDPNCSSQVIERSAS